MCLSAEWKDQAKTKLNLTNARNWGFFCIHNELGN